MKRALAIAAVAVGLFGGGMVAAVPSQAAVVKVGRGINAAWASATAAGICG